MSKKLNLLHLAIVAVVTVVIGLWLKATYKGDWFEFAAFSTGVIGVYLVAVEHIINWPVGLVNVSIYAYVFFSSKLYADMSLQVFFFILGVQGWYLWARGGSGKSQLEIMSIPRIWWLWIALLTVLGTAIYYPMIRHFNGAQPFVDSVLTVVSIIAQLLLNAKKLENWILWIFVDIAYIPLYNSRDLHSTVVLYVLFLALAISGLIGWVKTYRTQKKSAIGDTMETIYPRN